MAERNLPEWAGPHVTLEGWRALNYGGFEVVIVIQISWSSWLFVEHCGAVWIEHLPEESYPPTHLAGFGPDRLPEAIRHAENIAQTIQAAQKAAGEGA